MLQFQFLPYSVYFTCNKAFFDDFYFKIIKDCFFLLEGYPIQIYLKDSLEIETISPEILSEIDVDHTKIDADQTEIDTEQKKFKKRF